MSLVKMKCGKLTKYFSPKQVADLRKIQKTSKPESRWVIDDKNWIIEDNELKHVNKRDKGINKESEKS